MQKTGIPDELGLTYVIRKMEPQTPFGREQIQNLTFFNDRKGLIDEFSLVNAVAKWEKKQILRAEGILHRFKDVRRSLRNCAMGQPLNIIELFEIKRLCLLLEEMKTLLDEIGHSLGLEIRSIDNALKILDPQSKRNPDFVVDGQFSPRIAWIRERKREIDTKMDSRGQLSLQDKRDRDQLASEEQQEENAVCKRLSKELQSYCEEILEDCEVTAHIDLLLCKVRMMASQRAVTPTISDAREIVFEDMFNLEVLETVKSLGHTFTPISMVIGRGATVITGANMGGKSVSIKTLGLNVALAMCGWPVFARYASLPLIASVRYVGADNYENPFGLSSFGNEMHEIIEAMKAPKQQALLLFDEPARGTDPEEGAAIVKGIVEYLAQECAYAVITTHYDSVAKLATRQYRVLGIKDIQSLQEALDNADQFDATIFGRHMNYGLHEISTDCEAPREAVTICRLLGMPRNLIDSILMHLRENTNDGGNYEDI